MLTSQLPPPLPTDATTAEGAANGPATVHRGPVTALDGRVVGYTITVGFGPTEVPTQRTGSGPAAAPAGTPASPVSDEHLHATLLDLDLANLVADRYVFLAATPQMLQGFFPTPVAAGRLVLDLPAGFEHSPDAVVRAAALTALGARLSLPGYRGEAAQVELLPHLAFVVVDPGGDVPIAPLVHEVHAAGVRALAVDPGEATLRDRCRAAGVDALRPTTGEGLGHGSPSASPEQALADVVTSSAADGGTARVLRAGERQCLAAMHLLNAPEVHLTAVAQVIDTDPVLTLRLLHLVNSGAFALRREVDTVQQAVVLLGTRQVTTLVSGLMLDARPDAMDRLWFILARALACELLSDDSAGYTVGMLSALSDQLGVPVEAVLDTVGVSGPVAAAVLRHEGRLGWVLAAVRAHERHDTTGVLTAGMQPAEVSSTYVRCLADALATARAVTREPAA